MSAGGSPDADARDHDVERADLHDCWEGAAAGWGRQASAFGEQNAPVAHWMI
jgi:hypothetical protein